MKLPSSQQGLGLQTYQSDLFNNWLSTEWIDGTNGINAITAIDTSSGSFNIDTLNLDRKSTRLNSNHITRSRMPSSA